MTFYPLKPIDRKIVIILLSRLQFSSRRVPLLKKILICDFSIQIFPSLPQVNSFTINIANSGASTL